ncbi:site-specific integrase (plasmid) [Halorussus limi]|uniref:Site-specific integrase n=1 Tax=Halorussus limi TaxID=2938695 RepID=A0A8U0I280_9EURY|nr:site-specific integrase [Halorussus limi]UPV77163.1 site-specific integrase [Halorussus limi]
MSNTETPRYATMDCDDCEAYYWDAIAPEMQANGFDPDHETPTYSWLNRNYPGFVKHLSRQFDWSPSDFYDEYGIPPQQDAEESVFAFVEHDATREAIENYLEELADRRGRAESTVSTRRSILRQYLMTYEQVNDTTDLLSPLLNVSEASDEMDRVADTFDVLRQRDDALTTLAAKRKYVQEVRQFYKHQFSFGPAQYNPLDDLETRFGWDKTPDWDNPSLNANQVRTLYEAADTSVDRFIVVGVCGWGLRPSEVAALHMRQLPDSLDPLDDPYIQFEDGERKNGPGTVTMLTGLDVLRERISALTEREDWNGHLLPSTSAAEGHITTETVNTRFKRLARTADVTVHGETPTPKYGRRFWYTTYTRAVERVATRVSAVAEEQGSEDASVVLENYLSEEERRQRRREEMRDDLDKLFEVVGKTADEVTDTFENVDR